MGIYWVYFSDRKPGCVEAADETTALVAARLATQAHPTHAVTLPYPAEPRLVKKEYKDNHGNSYHSPSFCYTPEQCKGKGCCPKSYSCTE